MSYTYDITMFKDTFEHEFTWLNGFMRNVRRFGYKTAMVDPQKEQTWTYEELNKDANRLANALKASGVKKNDTILYLLQIHHSLHFHILHHRRLVLLTVLLTLT